MNNEKKINIFDFDQYALKGLNCKQIAEKFNIHPNTFGLKFKKNMGIYPSQYIVRMLKNG